MGCDVSALVVNYRTYGALERCLEALARVAPQIRLEVLVADNAPDAEAIVWLGARFPAATVIPLPENRGFGAAVNAAARQATGCYLLVLNADATLRPGACEALLRVADGHPDVAAVGPKILNPDGTVQGSARGFPDASTLFFGRRAWLTRRFPNNRWSRRNVVSGSDDRIPREADWVSGACLLVSKTAFDEVGGFDPGFFLYWEDADLCRRLLSRSYRVMLVPEAEVDHATASSTRLLPIRSALAFHRSAFRYARKHVAGLARLLLPVLAAFLAARCAASVAANAAASLRSEEPARPESRGVPLRGLGE